MSKLVELERLQEIARIGKANAPCKVVAMEGVDASGKSSIARALGAYGDCAFLKIPDAYVSGMMREHLSFSADPVAKALVYTASLIDRKAMAAALPSQVHFAVTDRSLWSTVALVYARQPEKVSDVVGFFLSVAKYVPIPAVAYVMDVPYEVCRARVSHRSAADQRHDGMPRAEFDRHMAFYRQLAELDLGVRIFKQDSSASAEVNAERIHQELLNK